MIYCHVQQDSLLKETISGVNEAESFDAKAGIKVFNLYFSYWFSKRKN